MVIVGIAYGVGYLVRAIFTSKMERLAERSDGRWDNIVIAELGRRIPFWSLLVGLWLVLGRWPLSPQTVTFSTRILSALGVGSITIALAAIASQLVRAYGPRATPTVPVSGLTQNLVRIFIFTIGVLVIVQGFGYDIRPMLAALGVGGLAVALALQQPLSNLFAGLFVSLAGQIRIGDYVRLEQGVEGTVSDFNWHSTQIHSPSGNLIIVPNSRVAQSTATNFTYPTKEMGLTVDFGVRHDADLQRVERIAVDAARGVMREVNGGVPDVEPVVRYIAIADLGVRFSVQVRVREFGDQVLVKHELIKRLHARLKAEGIAFAAPAAAAVASTAAPPSPGA